VIQWGSCNPPAEQICGIDNDCTEHIKSAKSFLAGGLGTSIIYQGILEGIIALAAFLICKFNFTAKKRDGLAVPFKLPVKLLVKSNFYL